MRYIYMLETALMVEDIEEAVEVYGTKFGIWPPTDVGISSLWEQPEFGHRVAFCPVADRALAPTFYALLQPVDPNHWLGREWKRQGPCPSRYHCIGFIVDDLDPLIRHFDRFNIPYNILTDILNTKEAQHVTGRRLFVGRPKGVDIKYDPSYDANAMVEILSDRESPIWRLPTHQAPPLSSLPPGAFVRIESWSLLVEDINKAIKLFGKNLFLWPAPGTMVQDIPEEGIKSVLIPIGSMPESTKLELVSPYDFNKPIGKWYKQWGGRLFHMRMLVKDLDARLRDLERRRVAFDVRPPSETLKYRRAWIDPVDTLGRDLEFVDYDDYIRSTGGR